MFSTRPAAAAAAAATHNAAAGSTATSAATNAANAATTPPVDADTTAPAPRTQQPADFRAAPGERHGDGTDGISRNSRAEDRPFPSHPRAGRASFTDRAAAAISQVSKQVDVSKQLHEALYTLPPHTHTT